MNDFLTYFIPILFLVNSFSIGKLIEKRYFFMNNAFSFVCGSIVLFSGLSIIEIIFIFADTLNNFFPYVILGFQILLGFFYLLNWKKYIFCLIPNWNKVLHFVLIFFLVSIPYFLFIYSDFEPVFKIGIQNNFSILNESINEIFKISLIDSTQVTNFFYKIWYPVFLIFLTSCCIYDFLNIKSDFDWKKLLIGIFSSLIFSVVIFNNVSIMESGYVLVFIYTIPLLSFFTSKPNNNEVSGYHFCFNTLILFFTLLDSNLLFYSAFLILVLAIFLYTKKTDFSLDIVTRSFLYLICSVAFFFVQYVNTPIKDTKYVLSVIIFSILLVVFLSLSSLYFVARKNGEKYFYKALLWQNIIYPKVKYLNLLFFLIVSIITIILLSQKNIVFDSSLFNRIFVVDSNKSIVVKNYARVIQISFYSFYALVLFFSVIDFFAKFKIKNKNTNHFLFTNITIVLLNPLFMILLNSLPDIIGVYVNTEIDFIFYLLFVFGLSSKRIIEFNKFDLEKNNFSIKQKEFRFKKIKFNITRKLYIENLGFIIGFSCISMLFVTSFLSISLL